METTLKISDTLEVGSRAVKKEQPSVQPDINESLRESEEFTRRILDSSSECIKVLDLDFKVKYMSPVGMKLMEVDDFANCEDADWTKFWDAENRSSAMAALDKALAGGRGSFHAFCPTMKGTPRWWDVVVTSHQRCQRQNREAAFFVPRCYRTQASGRSIVRSTRPA